MEKKMIKKEMCMKQQNSYFIQTDEQLAKFMIAIYSVEKINKMYDEITNKKIKEYLNEKHLQNL